MKHFPHWVVPILVAIIGLVAGLLGVSSSGGGVGLGFDPIMHAIESQGFSTVIAVALLLLLTYVIFEAVAHFNTRLDTNAAELSAGFREMSRVIGHLDNTLDRLALQAVANHELISSLMMFQAHTQSEIVAHRATMEPTDSAIPTPAPPIGVVKPVRPRGEEG